MSSPDERIARVRWTAELDEWLLAQCAAARQASAEPDWKTLASHALGSADAVRLRESRLRRFGPQIRSTPFPVQPPDKPTPAIQVPTGKSSLAPKDVHDLLDLPPRPLDVPRPRQPQLAIHRPHKTAVLFGDTHVEYQDDQALAVVEGIIVDTKPDQVIHLGDLLDCYGISRFSKDPTRLQGLQQEIDHARILLAQWRDLAPQAELHLLEGNHEQRLRSLIWNLPGASAELSRLTAFQKAIEWPMLLGLDAMHWHWVPTELQSKTRLIPKLITKHGTVVRKWSGWSGKGEWERYGKGGISGHVHRLGSFLHRDHNGTQSWHEAGCTCLLDPEYMSDPDWQHGALVVTYTDDWYTVEPVYIEQGRARWRGRDYLAP